MDISCHVTGGSPHLPVALQPVGSASGEARTYIRDILTALGKDALVGNAQLGVTELVTNACLHARTPIVVVVRVTADGAVRIEVSDDSPRLPERRAYDALATTGRGLALLRCSDGGALTRSDRHGPGRRSGSSRPWMSA